MGATDLWRKLVEPRFFHFKNLIWSGATHRVGAHSRHVLLATLLARSSYLTRLKTQYFLENLSCGPKSEERLAIPALYRPLINTIFVSCIACRVWAIFTKYFTIFLAISGQETMLSRTWGKSNFWSPDLPQAWFILVNVCGKPGFAPPP